MPLEDYERKRDFKKTPEPRGVKPSASGRLFVVQKHDASRLHYDFRLEMDGVLKSWAVPKGPSTNPKDRRLAVQVEDHPVEYASFEGTIPEGEYGGGTVMVWDRGTWEPEGDPSDSIARGRLKFRLDGEKLTGGWTLARMSGQSAGKEGENWLLIKERDDAASTSAITEDRQESALSGRDMDEITRGAKARNRGRKGGATFADPVALPVTVRPELATLVSSPPEGEEWLHEIKYDGYRLFILVDNGSVRLLTRRGQDWTARLGAVASAAASLPVHSAALDGELVALTDNGISSFGALQQALSEGRDQDLACYVFDLLHLDGRDVSRLPLLERKGLLRDLLGDQAGGVLRYSEHVGGRGARFQEVACEFGLEGVVSKRADAPYRPGRTHDWLKVKCRKAQEFIVIGYTEPMGGREGFGALLLGVHDADRRLDYAGKVGTGFKGKVLIDLARRLKALEVKGTPVTDVPDLQGAHWVKPEVVVEVAFAEWTRDGVLRQASFRGVREDRRPEDIVRETAESLPEVEAKAKPGAVPKDAVRVAPEKPPREAITRGATALRVTHPDRVFYPDLGLTKRDLLDYYEAVAGWMLPHLAGRPLTLVRCPNGAGGPCFYQKNAEDDLPPEVRRVTVRNSGGKDCYTSVDSLPGLLSLVQRSVLEFHTWGASVPHLDRPDRVVFDLDPDTTVPFGAVVRAALEMRDRLSSLGLVSFVKSTGGKGLHVVAPLERRHTWDEVKGFAKDVAHEASRQAPDRYTANPLKTRRAGRIYIDYLRNAEGATAVCAYSTRARPGAPVAVPLRWDELSRARPGQYTVSNVLRRLGRLREDPWAAYWSTRQSLR